MTQNFPRIVRDGSMHAIAVNADERNVHLLGLFGGQMYTEQQHDAATFGRTWFDVDEFNHMGGRLPTVEYFINALASSRLPIDKKALALLRHMKEQHMAHVVYVTTNGDLAAEPSEASIAVDAQRPIQDAVDELTAKLSERALARFVTAALKLTDELDRLKKSNAKTPQRIEEALRAVLPQRNDMRVADAADKALAVKGANVDGDKPQRKPPIKITKPKAEPQAAPKPKADDKPKDDTTKAPRTRTTGPSVKRIVYDYLAAGKRGTIEELMALCPAGITLSSVRTALSDIKNPKYAPDGKALKVVVNDGVYSIEK